jgi:hypothetical protein
VLLPMALDQHSQFARLVVSVLPPERESVWTQAIVRA